MTQWVEALADFMSAVLGWKQCLEVEQPLGTYNKASTIESLRQSKDELCVQTQNYSYFKGRLFFPSFKCKISFLKRQNCVFGEHITSCDGSQVREGRATNGAAEKNL